MKPFFFITCYDQITAKIIAGILNSLDKIECHTICNNQLLPTSNYSSIDEFIKCNKKNNNILHGNIYNFFYLDIEQRKQIEVIQEPFKTAVIHTPLIISIEFLLYSWFLSGLSPDQLLTKLLQQLAEDRDTNNILSNYNLFYFYEKLQDDAKYFPAQYQESINSIHGQLFLLALAISLTFRITDKPLVNETFGFLELLSNKNELNKLLMHVSNGELSLTDQDLIHKIPHLKQLEDIIEKATAYINEEWQLQLIQYCDKNLARLGWPRIQSQLFMLIQRTTTLDNNLYCLNHNTVYQRNNKNYYELIHVSPFESILDKSKMLNPIRIERVKKFGAKLLYDLSGEALTFSGEMDGHWYTFHNILQESGISSDKVYLMCSNYKVSQYYKEWALKHNIKYHINVIGNNFWLYLRAYEISINPDFIARKNLLVQTAKKTVDNNEKRLKHFMCLNLKARPHRTLIMLYLLHRHHLNKGAVTYFGRSQLLPKQQGDKSEDIFNPAVTQFAQHLPHGNEIISHFEKLESMRPIIYDKLADSLFSEDWPLSQFIPEMSVYGEIKQFDSYFEIITETYFTDEKSLFITEKTLRAFLRFQFFLVVGCPHTLKYLKEIGFQTFSPYIDESYDDIADPYARMTAICNEIDKLCQMNIDEIHELYCKLWPRILHNFEHFTSRMQNIFKSETDEILKLLMPSNEVNILDKVSLSIE